MLMRVKSLAVEKLTADLLIVPVWKGLKQQPEFQELDAQWQGAISSWMQSIGFEGAKKEWVVLPTLGALPMKQIAFVGLGERKASSIDDLRWIGGQSVKKSKELKAKTVAILSEPLLQTYRPAEASMAWMEGWLGGAYVFHAYHPELKVKEQQKSIDELLWIAHGSSNVKMIEKGIEEAESIFAGVHLARDLVNTNAHEMNPQAMAEIAQSIADASSKYTCTILDEKEMAKRQMNAALSVGRGSEHKPRLVHLIYKPKKQSKKRLCFVGKAVTFDTGGLSIKPSDGMVTMKCDMAGAATVLGLMKILPSLDIEHEIHGIFIAVENAVSAESYRPGDVVTAMNGTTIDIQNTDAEGRVVLADALLYAKEQQPHSMIDLATLTGACIVALGDGIAGVMGNDQRIIDRIKKASEISGEDSWPLPLPEKYHDHIKSRIAMIKNLGAKGQAGAIAGGLFLKYFVGTTPWAHLDIAGPAWTDRESRPDQSYGGTGFGVRLLARYLQAMS